MALVDDGAIIGEGSRVWAFSHILSGAKIGVDCNICDHTFIENDVVIGNRVTVKSGVYLWNGLKIEDDVFIGPAVVFSNDHKPRSKGYAYTIAETRLLQGCSIGSNATILPGLLVGRWSMIGAGSVVTKNVPDFAVVFGNPAVFQYWICKCTSRIELGSSNRVTCDCGEAYQFDHEEKLQLRCN
jgi:acetyltransferase-like isoleucine patch superfamily enzyme